MASIPKGKLLQLERQEMEILERQKSLVMLKDIKGGIKDRLLRSRKSSPANSNSMRRSKSSRRPSAQR